jgi:tetratricopeptide (TPR) repeat protein/tRNA A-37 threonylcarbamoyl transferase component Bud32
VPDSTHTSADGGATVLGDYQLGSLVARGGMGEIWRATDTRTGQPVAIKRLRLYDHPARDEAYRGRLLREARTLGRLQHEHIVRYLGSGLDPDGQPYLVLEWLTGEDLAQRHLRSPLDLAQVLTFIRQALEGLAWCHTQGVVHRDLKPSNLFLVETPSGPQVKVVDFGLALLGDDSTRLTRAGQVLGTLFYLSPEQARGGENVDHRTDIYAVGVMLYELCTGKKPFFADHPIAVLLKIVTETPPRPSSVRPDLPPWLERVIVRAMQRAPSDRFASAEEMAAALTPETRDVTLPIAALPAEGRPAQSLPPSLLASSMEYRLVSLLCVQPLEAGKTELAPVVDTLVAAGGIIHHLLGGQVVALFGLDRTVGDEAFRAIQAGLAVRDLVGARARLLASTVHIEVRQGLQLNGRDLDRTLQALPGLPPGELVLDRPTRQLAGERIQLRADGGHEIVVSLADEAPSRRRVLGVETPTVGRESELAAIRVAFQRSADNEESEAVLLLGPPGIGKSRLCQELLPELEGRCPLLLVARATMATAKTPYHLLAEAIRRRAGIHVGQPPEEQRRALDAFVAQHAPSDRANAATFIGETIGVPVLETASLKVARAEPKVMRERITAAFEGFFDEAGRRGPVCLCLEDLHWADEESLWLCTQLVERLDRTPLFILATARPELAEQHQQLFREVDAMRVELQQLGRRPLRRLIRAMLVEAVPPELEERIVHWCAGNPYFAEELVSWMVAQQVIVRQAKGWQTAGQPDTMELPVGIEGMIQGRLDRLAPEHKELVKAASVWGEVFWDAGCVALGFEQAPALLPQLERAEIVSACQGSRIAGTREWSFRHPMVQQVAYQMLPQEARQPLHQLAARWLEVVGETDAALLAYHFARGGDMEQAAECYARAGARALADGDLERAAEWYSSSLSTTEPTQLQLSRRRVGLARALILMGRYDEAWQAIEQLTGLAADHQVEVEYLKGRILLGRGRYAEAQALLEQGLAALEQTAHPDLEFDLRHTLFWVIWTQGRYGAAGRVAERLYTDALHDERPDHLCAAKLAFAYYNVVEGDLSASVELAGEAVAHAREIGHPFREVDALILLGSAQELVGLYDQAKASLVTAGTLAERLRTAFHRANIEICLGRVSLALDDPAAALGHFRRAAAAATSLDDQRSLAISLAGEASILTLNQELDQAAAVALRAVELSAKIAPPVEVEARHVLARVHLSRGNTAEAVAESRTAMELMAQLGAQERYEIEVALTAHDALAAAGQRQEAHEVLRQAVQQLRGRTRRIGDDQIRESFTGVPHNRRLVELWERAGDQSGC